MAAANSVARLALLTRKCLQAAARPAVSHARLARLAVNESYDDLLDGRARLRAVLREVERLAAQTDAAWESLLWPEGPLAAAVRDNQWQGRVSCGRPPTSVYHPRVVVCVLCALSTTQWTLSALSRRYLVCSRGAGAAAQHSSTVHREELY